jgi:uncharacterized protein DUF3501
VRKLTLADIKDLREYERERADYRARVLAMKKARRVQLGDLMTIVFENTETMRFQVQEMARVEKIISDESLAHEVATYNELIPDEGQLSGTLFIEINDSDELRQWLPRLVGIQRTVFVEVGGTLVAGVEDEERLTREDEVTTSVHYIRFSFTREQQAAFAAGPVRVVVDHPAYHAVTDLTEEQRHSLAADFAE